MGMMKGIIMSACFVSIAMSITGVMKPGDKFNSQIKIIFVLVFIIIVLTPMINNFNDFSFFKSKECFEETREYGDMNEYIDERVKESVETNLSETIKTKLSERGIICTYAQVNINMDENYEVEINDIVISNEIYSQAKGIIAEVLSVNESIIRGND